MHILLIQRLHSLLRKDVKQTLILVRENNTKLSRSPLYRGSNISHTKLDRKSKYVDAIGPLLSDSTGHEYDYTSIYNSSCSRYWLSEHRVENMIDLRLHSVWLKSETLACPTTPTINLRSTWGEHFLQGIDSEKWIHFWNRAVRCIDFRQI